MAGKGGGSWKVAYADFVTAMMAFFLVMWIGAQDVKVRQSVANYFIDPSGVSKAPKESGAVMPNPAPGSIPAESAVPSGQGTRAPSNDKPPNPATAAVMQWLRSDTARFQHWCGQAKRCRDEAHAVAAAANQSLRPEQIAARQLTQLLATELKGSVPKDIPEVYQRLLSGSLDEVNWEQVADDIMGA